MTNGEFDNYLTLVGKLLRLRGKQREQISGELRSHLEERLDELLSQGMPREQAVTMALEEFGDAAVLAADFVSLSRNRKRRWLMRAISFSVAAIVLFAVGIAILWPGRNAGPGPAAAVAQDPAATPSEADPTEAPPTAASAAPNDDSESSITEKLNQKLPIDFADLPLNDVMQALEQQTGLTFYLNAKKLEEAGVAVDTPVNLHFQNIRLSTFLDLMLDGFDLAYCVKDDLIVITTPEDAESNLEIRVYDCRDLLALPSPALGKQAIDADTRPAPTPLEQTIRVPISGTPTIAAPPTRFSLPVLPQFGGVAQPASAAGGTGEIPPVGDAAPSGGMGGDPHARACDDSRHANYDSLIDLITTNVDPQAWDEVGGPGSVSAYHGLIVVSQPAQVHKKIERLLDMLREAAGLDVPTTGKVVR